LGDRSAVDLPECQPALAFYNVPVPLGKLQTERMVPVDDFATQLVQRLRFFRSLDPLLDDGYLLARYSSKAALFVNCVITCTRSVILSISLPTLFPISFVTPMPRRCFEPGLVFLS